MASYYVFFSAYALSQWWLAGTKILTDFTSEESCQYLFLIAQVFYDTCEFNSKIL